MIDPDDDLKARETIERFLRIDHVEACALVATLSAAEIAACNLASKSEDCAELLVEVLRQSRYRIAFEGFARKLRDAHYLAERQRNQLKSRGT